MCGAQIQKRRQGTVANLLNAACLSQAVQNDLAGKKAAWLCTNLIRLCGRTDTVAKSPQRASAELLPSALQRRPADPQNITSERISPV